MNDLIDNQPDRLSKVEVKQDTLSRDSIHLFHDIHIKIVALQWGAVLMLIYVGYIIGEFWDSGYFSYGVPVMTKDVLLTEKWKYALLITLFAVDTLVSGGSSSAISKWRVNVISNPDVATIKDVSYWKCMFILLTEHVAGFLRNAVMIVFIYAQFDFALAFAVPSMLLGVWNTLDNIARYRARQKACATVSEAVPQNPDTPTTWGISPMMLAFGQLGIIVAYVAVFWIIGYFDTPYFDFSMPFVLFGKLFKSGGKYAFALVFVFVDQIIYTVYNYIVGPYIIAYLQNDANPYIQGPEGRARFIYISKHAIMWARMLLMLNFIMSKFTFLLVMLVADFSVTFWMLHRTLSTKLLTERDAATMDMSLLKNKVAFVPLSPYIVTVVMLLEIFAVALFAIAQLRIYNLPYFQWPPPLLVFETVIATKGRVAALILYAVIDTVIRTFSTEITAPYIANVVVGCDPNGMPYDDAQLFVIMFMYDLTSWLRRVVAYNFILSNFSLVLFQAATDVGVSWVIADRYIKYKRRVLAVMDKKHDALVIKAISLHTSIASIETKEKMQMPIDKLLFLTGDDTRVL